MVTRSGAGGRMPPAVGVVNESVTAMRPDLLGMAGFTVRVPKAFDIETAEGPHERAEVRRRAVPADERVKPEVT